MENFKNNFNFNIAELEEQLNKIKELKEKNNFNNHSLKQLQELPTFNGVCKLHFKEKPFYMINLSSDDAVFLKYLWRDRYEELSLSLWYEITRKNGIFFDVGAHTGIYSLIGNLEKNVNNIISIEPFFINFSRLLSNLKINNLATKNCILAAVSNEKGFNRFEVKQDLGYHSAGGKLSDEGKFNVPKIKIDDCKFNSEIKGIKIDTEGHEFEVLKGAENYIDKDKPDIIFEINNNCFDSCLDFLKTHNYYFYFLDEKQHKTSEIENFSGDFLGLEGENCYATINKLKT